ncbi:hypothetical protein FRC08_016531, partial [Ceratobasidium sp. 394]
MSEARESLAAESVDGGKANVQLEVFVTLNTSTEVPAARTHSATKTIKQTRMMMFFVPLSELTLDKLLLEALAALDFDPAEISEPTSIPFTYYHKGRGVKSTIGVKTIADFENMLQVLEKNRLMAVSIILARSDIKCLTDQAKAPAGTSVTKGLAGHTRIPNVTILSQLERERAKITQKLKDAWPCDDHGLCYIKGDVHEHITHFRLSSWANHI